MALSLDDVGRRYGQRPSSLVGILDRARALEFDLAITVRARQARTAQINEWSREDHGGVMAVIVALLREMT